MRISENFFCRKSKKYYVNCPREKTLDKNLCFSAYGEDQRKRTKKPKKQRWTHRKNVRNVGKIRIYEKTSITRRDTLEYPAARPLHRRWGEHGEEKSVPCGHSVCHVLSGCIRQKCMFAPQWGVFYGYFIYLCWFSHLF